MTFMLLNRHPSTLGLSIYLPFCRRCLEDRSGHALVRVRTTTSLRYLLVKDDHVVILAHCASGTLKSEIITSVIVRPRPSVGEPLLAAKDL